jgi:hypothetical protein
MIYSILAPDYEEMDPTPEGLGAEEEPQGPRLVQIDAPATKKPS